MSWNSVIPVVCVFTSILMNCSRGENIQTEKIQQTISSNPVWLISRWPSSLCDFALQTLSRSNSQPKARRCYSSMQSVRRLPFKKFTRQFPSVCLASGAGEPLADEATLLSAHHLIGGSFGFFPAHCGWHRTWKTKTSLSRRPENSLKHLRHIRLHVFTSPQSWSTSDGAVFTLAAFILNTVQPVCVNTATCYYFILQKADAQTTTARAWHWRRMMYICKYVWVSACVYLWTTLHSLAHCDVFCCAGGQMWKPGTLSTFSPLKMKL